MVNRTKRCDADNAEFVNDVAAAVTQPYLLVDARIASAMSFKQYGIRAARHGLTLRAGLLILGRQVLARQAFSPFACGGDRKACGGVYAATILALDLYCTVDDNHNTEPLYP